MSIGLFTWQRVVYVAENPEKVNFNHRQMVKFVPLGDFSKHK
jgi:hypothetical protein